MSKPDAVLVIGAGMLQVPMLHAAQALALHVICTDLNPEAPGVDVADQFYVMDCADAVGTAGLIPAIQDTYTLQGVVCCGGDFAPTVALCAERAGLTGIPYITACLTHNKALVRDRLDEAGLAGYQPRWLLVAGDWSTPMRAEAISRGILGGWPVVVKPLEQRASRGVSIVRQPEDFPAAVAQAMMYGQEYLIEECLVGTEHSAEILLDDGRVLWQNIVDRYFDYTSGTGIELGHVNPTSLPPAQQYRIHAMVLTAADALGVQWGPFKVDVLLTNDGPKILECTARLSGGWDSQWTSPATGRHPMRQLVQLACRLPVDQTPAPEGAAACAAILPTTAGLMPPFSPTAHGAAQVVWAMQPGQAIHPARHNGERAGYALVWARGPDAAWYLAWQTARNLAAKVDAAMA